MSQRKLRARDIDRDAAIDVVESAWADGQLTREEYEQRVERLLQAPNLRDLEQEIADLQADGVEWRPPSMSSPVLAAAARSGTSQQNAPSSTSHRTPALVALVVTGLVAAGLLGLAKRGSDRPGTPTEPLRVEAVPSLLTPATFTLVRQELVDHAGNDTVYSATLTDDRWEVVRPTSAAGTDAAQMAWDGQWSVERPASASGERLSLGLVNAEAVTTIVADAHQQVGGDVELKLLFQIVHRGDQRVCITATAAGDTTWTGRYDCRGQEVGR